MAKLREEQWPEEKEMNQIKSKFEMFKLRAQQTQQDK